MEELSLNTPKSSSPMSPERSKDFICLCAPPFKIPRPRNAFILYRQHHQGQVVAQHPGLANPEISKIIGEQWRDEPEEEKNQWRRLAEEEKLRHQKQYPDYRYQPRRGGKAGIGGLGSSSMARPSLSVGEDPGRCSKCGGRNIATPRTPSTPLTSLLSSSTPTVSSISSVLAAARAGSGNVNFESPPYINPDLRGTESDNPRQRPYGGKTTDPELDGPRSLFQPSAHEQQHSYHYGNRHLRLQSVSDNYDMGSSEAKRRRFNLGASHSDSGGSGNPSVSSLESSYGKPSSLYTDNRNTGRYPTAGNSITEGALAGPVPLFSRTGSTSMPISSMGPPPAPPPPPLPPRLQSRRPSVIQSGPLAYRSATHAASSFDESLRLPPLQTQVSAGETFDRTNQRPKAQEGVTADITPREFPSTARPATSGTQSARGSTAPLSAGTPWPPPGHHRGQQQEPHDSQDRSVEAMVMSIPYTRRLKVLQSISPPLPNRGQARTSATATGKADDATILRGPIVAIEGDASPSLIEQVGGIVEKALISCGECDLSVWETRTGRKEDSKGDGSNAKEQSISCGESTRPKRGGGIDKEGQPHSEVQVASCASSAGSTDVRDSFAPGSSLLSTFYLRYLQTIMEWHVKSLEMVRHVTAPSRKQSSSRPGAETSKQDSPTSPSGREDASPDVEMAGTSAKAVLLAREQAGATAETGAADTSMEVTHHGDSLSSSASPELSMAAVTVGSSHVPVALVKGGFSLRISDQFACQMPIVDLYAPVDHWHWMATLWRGVVGADLVIYVRAASPHDGLHGVGTGLDEAAAGALRTARGQPGVTASSVEIESPGIVVVRVGSDGTVDKKTERRLGFEVVEWVRAGTFRD
ncbi:hypothetical protein VTK73DRAFT_2646 [Phialemonium thermophilum]|uniref:HMG box domain-containing protein n=1 Tax=Phialemonium thermophilum TaxID=223376 RepID=A0ABR3X394_9PEZI